MEWDVSACMYMHTHICVYVWGAGKMLTLFPNVGSTWGNREYTNSSNPPVHPSLK